MKTRILRTPALAAALLATLPCAALAATSFTEDFSGNALPANMTESGGTPTYTSSNATFGGASRYYVHTIALDHSAVDFVAEGTVTLTSVNPDSTSFFGMGPGTATPAGATLYSTPSGPSIFAEIAPAAFANGFVRYNDRLSSNSTTSTGTLGQNNGGWGTGSVHRVRLTWDSATGMGAFELDQGYTGTFSSDFAFTIDGSDNGFDATNSSIFFGGGQGSSWDDISVTVIPEPSAFALIGIAGLGLLRRRRR